MKEADVYFTILTVPLENTSDSGYCSTSVGVTTTVTPKSLSSDITQPYKVSVLRGNFVHQNVYLGMVSLKLCQASLTKKRGTRPLYVIVEFTTLSLSWLRYWELL